MTTKATMTRTIRLAIGTAAVLALMAQAAQAKPIAEFPQGVPAHESTTTLVRKGTYMPVSPANNVAAAHAANPDNRRAAVTATANAGSTNWAAVSIGAGILVALALICAAALPGKRRRIARST